MLGKLNPSAPVRVYKNEKEANSAKRGPLPNTALELLKAIAWPSNVHMTDLAQAKQDPPRGALRKGGER